MMNVSCNLMKCEEKTRLSPMKSRTSWIRLVKAETQFMRLTRFVSVFKQKKMELEAALSEAEA